VVVVALAGIVVAGISLSRGAVGDSADPGKSAGVVRSIAVTRTDLANTVTLQGTLGYADEQPVAGIGGRVTWLPAMGKTVSRGKQLFRVDDQPVSLFYGDTPLFRALTAPGLVGRDVKVVADNLRALGYDIGAQPAVGTRVTQPAGGNPAAEPRGATPLPELGSSSSGPSGPPATTPSAAPTRATSVKVRKGDAVLTTSLLHAIERWQNSVGLNRPEGLGAADVVVLPYEVRVTGITARLGEEAGAPLITVASTKKVVTAQVQPLEAESVRAADKVSVTLPDNSTATATVLGIGKVAKQADEGAGAGGDRPPTLTVTVEIDRAAAVKDLDAASVQVELTGEVKRGVLAVPVGALLALSEGGYGVQVQGGALVGVTTGLFVKGMVEISGAGITEGTKVVTTA
jgi:hypothetical protein